MKIYAQALCVAGLVAAASLAAAQDTTVSYVDKSVGFALRHPAGWQVSKKLGPTGSATTFVDAKTLAFGCVVFSHPALLPAQKEELRKLAQRRPVDEQGWRFLLDKQGYKAVQLVASGAGRLAGKPAHSVEFAALSPFGNYKFHAHGLMLTAPAADSLWKIDCVGIGATRAIADKAFHDAQASLRQVQESLRFE